MATIIAAPRERLSLGTKLLYGTGDWGMASYNTLRQIFYAIFLTDVVGLDPRLASVAVFVGILWDAINDPLVGMLSDRLHTRWGRRRPFFLFFAVPFGLCFLLLWWAPPWTSQLALMATITLAFMISDTLQTLVVVPFLALTPELTPDYDERTSLTSFRMFFNLLASLITAAAAPEILQAMLGGGFTQQQGYLLIAALFGGLAMLPFLAMFFFLRERPQPETPKGDEVGLRETIRTAWGNVPFRFATALNVFAWSTLDLISLMLPFFLTYWIAQGNLLAKADLFGVRLALQSAVLGILFIVAMICLPLWVWLARRLGKRNAFIIGMASWGVVQFAMFWVQPGQMGLILALTVLAGISVSSAHVLPDAIFPDVVEWDELRTRRRHEGVYYGAKNFSRKLTGAFATFIALQALGWFGYQAPPAGALQFSQPAGAVNAIRALTGPIGALLMLGAIAVAWFYPITRERHGRIRALLARRQGRST
ncbi:MAG: MFS transporter [Chloroflexi bacterium]|nr:MFS transporter [Chloroflexota bacterium]